MGAFATTSRSSQKFIYIKIEGSWCLLCVFVARRTILPWEVTRGNDEIIIAVRTDLCMVY